MQQREEFLRVAMREHGDAVYRLALCRMQNGSDAEDVYQDVFLRLFQQPDRRWEPAHLRAWLLRTTVNRCTDLHRRKKLHPQLSLEALSEKAAEQSGTSELWAAVGQLPPPMRTVVHLYYGEGYQTEEIAKLLRCPAATVRTRLRRARIKLRDLLGGDEYEAESVP